MCASYKHPISMKLQAYRHYSLIIITVTYLGLFFFFIPPKMNLDESKTCLNSLISNTHC